MGLRNLLVFCLGSSWEITIAGVVHLVVDQEVALEVDLGGDQGVGQVVGQVDLVDHLLLNFSREVEDSMLITHYFLEGQH